MTIQIKLPPTIESFAQAQASERCDGDIAAYINTVLMEEQERVKHERSLKEKTGFGSSEEDRIDQALLEALNDEEELLTPEFWSSIRQQSQNHGCGSSN